MSHRKVQYNSFKRRFTDDNLTHQKGSNNTDHVQDVLVGGGYGRVQWSIMVDM